MDKVPWQGCTIPSSVPEIHVLQRQIEIGILEKGDHRLQIVALFSSHAHLVTLDGRLHLELLLLDAFDHLSRQFGIYALANGEGLVGTLTTEMDFPFTQRGQVDPALDEFFVQDIQHLPQLKLVLAMHHNGFLSVIDVCVAALEIETCADFTIGLVHRIGQFMQINLGNDVK